MARQNMYVGYERNPAMNVKDAIGKAYTMLGGQVGVKIPIYSGRKLYGWVELCRSIGDGQLYPAYFRMDMNVGRTVLSTDGKLGHGQRWTRRTPPARL